MTKLDYKLIYDVIKGEYSPSEVMLDKHPFELKSPPSNQIVVDLVMERITPDLIRANRLSTKPSVLEIHDSIWLT